MLQILNMHACIFIIYIYISVVKQLITINRIQNNNLVIVCTVYIYYVYINTHKCMYTLQKKTNMYMFIYHRHYMNINIGM